MSFLLSTLATIWGYDLTYLEFLAVVTSLVGVWLGTTGKQVTWPWWAISSALYAVLFWKWDLKASAALQFVFIAAAIFGWLGWGPKGATPKVAGNVSRVIVAVAGLALMAVMAPWLSSIGAAATWPDSFGLIFSIVAQYIMVREYRENWALWFIVDGVYSVEYCWQKLWFTGALYVLFTVIAIRGWLRWTVQDDKALDLPLTR
jgi:nicotinamide mononucleotide transporter